ncbi:MAG: homoserine O-succinyltransferase [Candidatus Sedimenticola endophacoides]|uniref:Probable acyltransferase n=1 Tax=Candidatus Sedimenticola endophacoides TaxID=2548426 RepID=A0A657PMU3_9GAMM|nr:MAG: homoserine O-succinyltransferase [Candidatus Sedimenticola endophacoides]OQX32873.1 MAG: homoserine O-succinyltransferase [Candidatus Sedimenticola endophacoides]OQX33544.1 MAG: homoserine O-succinyltransferase [Candidatus Sedimenticola endophacoides]OQX38361.1 MAG: homoserine O-succinyltransferase [Candidatus Sedimenticola endophacoides]OQX45127.1 MAG: homoserine O-succinyltransferase [Candidatus Sedimenticola endophacoides]
MPLVSHNQLPTFERLRRAGQTVLEPDRALHQHIRELHIGLLNMMPDAAIEATERQFFQLIGESNPIAQFYVHPFTLDELPRGDKARAHIDRYYESFDEIKARGLDALIVTGAAPTHPNLSDEPFWKPLGEVVDWAYQNVTSTLFSCLATHAVMEFRFRQRRQPLGFKRWGVFHHRVMDRHHPLVNDVNTLFDVPHSRFNEISREQFEAAGLHILVESEEAGVHLATSPDRFRMIFFQGHPEYETISLLKEYKREVIQYALGKRPDYPPFPDHYLHPREKAIFDEYRERLEHALASSDEPPEFPEALVTQRLDNTWHDTAEGIVGNWIGTVYQITHSERSRPFMEGVDPDDPLDLGLR